jgi:hypothetical protein
MAISHQEPLSRSMAVDRLILSGGTIVPADWFCSIHLQADGQIVYMVEGHALTHDGRVFEFKFTPSLWPYIISKIQLNILQSYAIKLQRRKTRKQEVAANMTLVSTH